jgi:hypothetical protein
VDNVFEADRFFMVADQILRELGALRTVFAPARGEGPPWAAAETSAHIESAAIVIISSMSSVE